MILLLKYKEGLLPHPPLQIKRSCVNYLNASQHISRTSSYVLKSGRRVRSVRQVYVQSNGEVEDICNDEASKELSDLEIIAEAAYIFKPIAHLSTLYFAGRKSWKPWILSLSMDIASLIILYRALTKNEISDVQKKQVLHRRFGLLVYLLRSPFYDRNTKRILEIVLYSLEYFVPCTSRFLVRPLLAHLPLVQQIYFYLWSH